MGSVNSLLGRALRLWARMVGFILFVAIGGLVLAAWIISAARPDLYRELRARAFERYGPCAEQAARTVYEITQCLP